MPGAESPLTGAEALQARWIRGSTARQIRGTTVMKFRGITANKISKIGHWTTRQGTGSRSRSKGEMPSMLNCVVVILCVITYTINELLDE